MPRYYHLDANCLQFGKLLGPVIALDRERHNDVMHNEVQLALTASALYEQTGFDDAETFKKVRGEDYRLHGELLKDIHFYAPGYTDYLNNNELSTRISTAQERLNEQVAHFVRPEKFATLHPGTQADIKGYYKKLVKSARAANPGLEFHDELRLYPADDHDEAHTLQNEMVRAAFKQSITFRRAAIVEDGRLNPSAPLGPLLTNMADDELVGIVDKDLASHAANSHVVITDDIRAGTRVDADRARYDHRERYSQREAQGSQSLYKQLAEMLYSAERGPDPEQHSFVMTGNGFGEAVAQACGYMQLDALDEEWKRKPLGGHQNRIRKANAACIEALGAMKPAHRRNAQDVAPTDMHDFARYLADVTNRGHGR